MRIRPFSKRPAVIAAALVVVSCCFSAAAAAPAKGVRSAPVPAAAQVDTPYAAYDRQDVPALTAMADQGDAMAQNNLGAMYEASHRTTLPLLAGTARLQTKGMSMRRPSSA